MKILEHYKDASSYHVRIWIDEQDPDTVEIYNWGKETPSQDVSEEDYIKQQLAEATLLAQDECKRRGLVEDTTTEHLFKDVDALAAHAEAVKALEAKPEDSEPETLETDTQAQELAPEE